MKDIENNINTGIKYRSNDITALFKYQLDWLKIEIELIDRAIERFDKITQATKNWAIVTWAGSIALTLGQTDLRRFIIITAVLPLIFWSIDGWWRYYQRRSIFRLRKISEFLNDARLVKSFNQQKLVEFTVLDPTGRQYYSTPEFKSFTRVRRIIRFKEVSFFYGSLALLSIALGLFFILDK